MPKREASMPGPVTAAMAVASVVMVGACSTQPAANPPERLASEATLVRLYVFDCGTLQADVARFRLKREEVATSDLSVPCFLVAHPRGRLIWDPGAVPDADWKPTGGAVIHHLVLPDSGRARTYVEETVAVATC